MQNRDRLDVKMLDGLMFYLYIFTTTGYAPKKEIKMRVNNFVNEVLEKRQSMGITANYDFNDQHDVNRITNIVAWGHWVCLARYLMDCVILSFISVMHLSPANL